MSLAQTNKKQFLKFLLKSKNFFACNIYNICKFVEVTNQALCGQRPFSQLLLLPVITISFPTISIINSSPSLAPKTIMKTTNNIEQ